ncbi:hypothetical protein [Shewanella sp. CG_4_10_14_0_8_um_filter_42_13]|uniref:hypothetical protein n=1 Tax=Shewanella sp. CG_4_10_14_0_8_um_filter_42_13 TaxID=1975534 RepID=UPI000CB66E71|nr:hypothetical protein [Shewanella sp. CG_4_10_14_0_8_um_filter_42_13]PIY67144.1 MAG: hypothetical protein COY92_07145 [Shewanella sp. CG_4_10_14_0_8_um_filter_42_13]
MSEINMNDTFVLPVSSHKGDLFNSKNPISDTRVCKFFNMNQYQAAKAASIAINSYDANQALITKQAEQVKVLREALTDLASAVFVNDRDFLKKSIMNASKALEATKD